MYIIHFSSLPLSLSLSLNYFCKYIIQIIQNISDNNNRRMESLAVMGSCELSIAKFGGVRELLGFHKGNNNGSSLIWRNRVCYNGFMNISEKKSDGFGLNFNLKAVHAQFKDVDVDVDVSPPTTSNHSVDGVKLFVGLPMDVVSQCGKVNHERAITTGLKALKLMGIQGVELPVWWGVVEKHGMGKYDWSGYLAISEIVQKMGLKLHVSLCFHASQQQNISLPDWVSQIGETDSSIYFTDRSARQFKDCLSFAVDQLPVLNGKSPVQVYQEFSESFKSVFSPFMGSTITGITIGLGPDGELRYPCHHGAKPTNQIGAGEFQCYDKYMLSHLKDHAQVAGCPQWGLGGPHDVPAYDEPPFANNFFKDDGGSWETAYGDFFLSWYSSQLLSHGDCILSLASTVFSDIPVTISGKLPLVHFLYQSRSHPSELTAGFYNTANQDGYEQVAEMFANKSCRMILPQMELSASRALLSQIKGSCRRHGVGVTGQNSTISGGNEFEEIRRNLCEDDDIVDLFIYQRMGAEFFSPKHFPVFSEFARTLNQSELDVDDMPDNGPVESLPVRSEAGVRLQVQTA